MTSTVSREHSSEPVRHLLTFSETCTVDRRPAGLSWKSLIRYLINLASTHYQCDLPVTRNHSIKLETPAHARARMGGRHLSVRPAPRIRRRFARTFNY